MRQVVMKQSPIVIMRNFLIVEGVAIGAFFLLAVVANYARLYRELHLGSYLSYEIAELVFMIVLEVVIVLMVFLRWSRDKYIVNQKSVTKISGMVFRRREVEIFEMPVSVFMNQGLLSWLVPYGTVTIREESTNKVIKIKLVATPRRYRDAISALFKVPVRSLDVPEFIENIQELLKQGEHGKLEYKMSFRWDARQGKVNKHLERGVVKTVAAFLNSEGGQLIVGVDDKGGIYGVENDYKSLGKANPDGFENHFNNLFMQMVGAEFRRFVRIKFQNIDGRDVCLVTVRPSDKPAYVRTDDGEDFFIRTGNSTTALRVSETATYVGAWWQGNN